MLERQYYLTVLIKGKNFHEILNLYLYALLSQSKENHLIKWASFCLIFPVKTKWHMT